MRFILTKFALIGLFSTLFAVSALADNGKQDTVVTLIFTNDMESAYEPVPAWWRDDMEHIGGIAELTTLIKEIRRDEPNVFLFDSGDIFTGALSRLTDGALMFEFMTTMGYDAMAIGNHEFDYGEAILLWQKNRAAFPVLSANLFFKDSEHRLSPHPISMNLMLLTRPRLSKSPWTSCAAMLISSLC
jgi:2',3'-cyclic-nucleotide 2'-phosphodiesterase (5'-nucleotidase family)